MYKRQADGVAAARMLEHDGIKTTIKLVGNIEHASEEMKKQLEIAKNLGISFVTDMKKNEYDIIVDAIFGIGLSREITGEYREIIEKINGSNSYIISVDISSGVDATGGKILGTAVKADMTVTFGNLKRGMLLFPGAVYSGEIKVKDIGFPDKAVESVSPKAYTDVYKRQYVLSAKLGTSSQTTTSHGVAVTVPASKAVSNDTIGITNAATVEEFIANINENLVRQDGTMNFTLKGTNVNYVFTPHYNQDEENYGIYWTYYVDADGRSSQAVLEEKQKNRIEDITVDKIEQLGLSLIHIYINHFPWNLPAELSR